LYACKKIKEEKQTNAGLGAENRAKAGGEKALKSSTERCFAVDVQQSMSKSRPAPKKWPKNHAQKGQPYEERKERKEGGRVFFIKNGPKKR